MLPLTWKNTSSYGSTWKSVRWLGPPTTITTKSLLPGNISRLPTGGFSVGPYSASHSGKLTGSCITPSTSRSQHRRRLHLDEQVRVGELTDRDGRSRRSRLVEVLGPDLVVQ